ncbi:MAG: hypothetical protein ACTSR8_13680 [Promethearchaeota archaeon]
MSLKPPQKADSEFLVYLWKIIDLPRISKTELKYRISFELFLKTPSDASELITRSIQNNLLTLDKEDIVALSPDLQDKLQEWQIKRKKEIMQNIAAQKNSARQVREVKTKKTSFSVLLKAFLDKGTLNRAASISNNSVNLMLIDPKKGIIKAKISGSKENVYHFEYNKITRTITHNCQDFTNKRLYNKKFCKHITKVFLILKDKQEERAVKFLEYLAEDIDNWMFQE